MNPFHKDGLLGHWRDDLPAGLVVFLVALPLCLGIALASGAPPFAGIIAGIVGGTVVALVSRSPLGVSGPAAGLAVIVFTAIQDLGPGAFEKFLLAVVIAGIIQLILGFARAGIIGYYFPTSVIKGMLSGIGIVIILKQIPHILGYDQDLEGDFEFFQADGHNTLSELFYMLNGITPGAVVIAMVSLALLIIWEQPFMKRQKFTTLIQGPLVAVLTGIGLNLLFSGNETLAIDPQHLVEIPVPDSFSGFLGQFTFPDFSQLGNKEIYIIGITMAIVASLETLLCVEATDKLDPYKRVTPTNRELQAQGIGNIISGLIGGLPITQVIVRSSANIQSGGKTKAAAFFHGILLLISAMAIPLWLNMIPLASLAAILLMVGYKLAKPAIFKEMYQLGLGQFVPFIVTILGIVFTDLLIGIALGMVIAVFYILFNNYKTPFFFSPQKEDETHFRLELAQEVTFINKAAILNTLHTIPPKTHVVIDASRSINIDRDVIEIIEDFRENAKHKGIELTIVGLHQKERTDHRYQFHTAISQKEPSR
ncbi:MAG: SulP family inorganic anion transporter [Bacteroidia bacterium]